MGQVASLVEELVAASAPLAWEALDRWQGTHNVHEIHLRWANKKASLTSKALDNALKASAHQRLALRQAERATSAAFITLVRALHAQAPILRQLTFDLVRQRNVSQTTWMVRLSHMGGKHLDHPTLVHTLDHMGSLLQGCADGPQFIQLMGQSDRRLRVDAANLREAAMLWQALQLVHPERDPLRGARVLKRRF